MSRYIDADELKKKAKYQGHCIRPLVTAYHMCVDVHDIDNAPTINPEDLRKKGKWVRFEEPHEFYDRPMVGYECSVCGRKEVFKEPYCHCGAKMEG